MDLQFMIALLPIIFKLGMISEKKTKQCHSIDHIQVQLKMAGNGQVMGLAWTSMGGSALYVESVARIAKKDSEAGVKVGREEMGKHFSPVERLVMDQRKFL